MNENRVRAITFNKTKYIGKKCKGCGGIWRYSSNGYCVRCAKEAVKTSRQRKANKL